MTFHLASSALRGALNSRAVATAVLPRAIVAGATGLLGAEVLRRISGGGQFSHVDVLAKEPITTMVARVGMVVVEVDESCKRWPALTMPADVGVVMFEPPRLYYDRERALWTPAPDQLLGLARWLRRCGVQTLVVVMPHAQGRLPEALKRGLANLDEHGVATLGFERVLLVRSPQKSTTAKQAGFFKKTAAWMLSVMSYMMPATEQPVRPKTLAEFIEVALRVLPPGTHVAPPELLWRASHGKAKAGGMHAIVNAWLNGGNG